MCAGMDVERLAEMQFAFPTFTEGVSMPAQKLCHSHCSFRGHPGPVVMEPIGR